VHLCSSDQISNIDAWLQDTSAATDDALAVVQFDEAAPKAKAKAKAKGKAKAKAKAKAKQRAPPSTLSSLVRKSSIAHHNVYVICSFC
jgi:hypothetical protein